MKTKILNTAIIVTLLATEMLLFGHGTGDNSSGNSSKSRQNPQDEKQTFVEASENEAFSTDSLNDSEFQKFKNESENIINENEKAIEQLKMSHEYMTDKENTEYKKKVSELEEKNNDLKQQLANYKKDQNKDRWMSFKTEFNQSMDDLGKALKDLTSKNNKSTTENLQ
jgi:hypothetical protein